MTRCRKSMASPALVGYASPQISLLSLKILCVDRDLVLTMAYRKGDHSSYFIPALKVSTLLGNFIMDVSATYPPLLA